MRRISVTAKTVEKHIDIKEYDIAELKKGARSIINQDIISMLMMTKSKDNKSKRMHEQTEEREEKKRNSSGGEGEMTMEMEEEEESEPQRGEGASSSFYSESSFNLKDINKEEVLFKNGKIRLEEDKAVKNNKEDRAKKCFIKGHKGSCIISIRLKEEKTGTRGNTNYAKLIDLVIRKGWRPVEAVKTGFRSADLHYYKIEKANKVYKEMMKMEGIECNILDKNLEAWGVIQDWDDKVIQLAEAIDDKKHLNSIERITYRKYDREIKDKFETVATKNLLIKFNGRTIPDFITIYGGLPVKDRYS